MHVRRYGGHWAAFRESLSHYEIECDEWHVWDCVPGVARVVRFFGIGLGPGRSHDPGTLKSASHMDGTMKAWSYRSGAWEPCGSLPLDDRAFRYGMSVFETIAIVEGRPLFLGDHLARLGRAASDRGWQDAGLPASAPRIAKATGVLRLYLTAGPGGVCDPLSGSCVSLFEECEVGTEFPPARVVSSSAPYLPGPGGWKTGNYWQNVDAMVAARSQSADDALLFNPAGCLVSASMGNLFLEVDGGWKTPALETGARDGVVRAWVMKNLPVEESLLDMDSLACATSGFLTNSRVGIRPIGEWDGRAWQTDVSALQQLYRDEIL